MKISKGTIVRTICLIIVCINMVLKVTGHSIIPVDDDIISQYVELFIEVLVIIVSFWKNNSFSKNAVKADEFLKQLNSENNDTEV